MNELTTNTKESLDEEKNMKVDLLTVPNAGLALISIWLPRLFSILGLLNERKTGFHNTDSQIRAIFIMQRLVNFVPQEYNEQELIFNRILTGTPFSIPLPKQLELTKEETETTNSLLLAVKVSWDKMSNTSTGAFQSRFIERTGHLEEKEEKWMLTVDERPYDILLDTIPWSYSIIRFPWLQKEINVLWHK